MCEHKHENGVCNCKSMVAAQSLSEMDFDRGIWSAGELMSFYIICNSTKTLRFQDLCCCLNLLNLLQNDNATH